MSMNALRQRTSGWFGGIFPGWAMVVGGAVQNFLAYGCMDSMFCFGQ